MADGVKNSKFTQEEFDKEVKVTLDGLKSGEKSVTNIARRVENVLPMVRQHPFGEFVQQEIGKQYYLGRCTSILQHLLQTQ